MSAMETQDKCEYNGRLASAWQLHHHDDLQWNRWINVNKMTQWLYHACPWADQ